MGEGDQAKNRKRTTSTHLEEPEMFLACLEAVVVVAVVLQLVYPVENPDAVKGDGVE